MIVLLDSTPLGLLSSPNNQPKVVACANWLSKLELQHEIIIPEIIDYEVRRELLRLSRIKSLRRLDRLQYKLKFLPLTSAAMLKAAELWATARKSGYPTADDQALDIDVILAAQALTLDSTEVVVATSNVGHLSKYVNAAEWSEIG